MQLLGVSHPVQVQDALARDRVQVKQLVELAQLEEQDFLEVGLLDLPVLDLSSRELVPEVFGNPDGGGIVVRVIWAVPLGVSEILFLEEVR